MGGAPPRRAERRRTRALRRSLGTHSPSRISGLGRREAQAAATRRAQGASAPAEIAAELGFADQAHLCREMRELWGTTPGRLLASDFFKTDSAPQPTKAP
jgi:AraC-like DNA-binding protein